MVENAKDDSTQILNQLSSLVQDELHIVTYKYLSRKLNIPFDISKRILYRYLSNNCDNVDATYFLSGWTSGATPQHVVKVVDQESLENEKASLAKVDSLHIYSIQPRRMATTESLYENDLSQSKIQDLPDKLVTLGRVRLEGCQSMHQGGKPTPTKMRESYRKEDSAAIACTTNGLEDKVKETKMKDARSSHTGTLPVKVVEKAGNHKNSSQVTKTGNVNKRKMQVIDSDDEGVADMSVHGDKKFRTYINDNGEEVTEIMEKTNEASNQTTNTTRIQKPNPHAQKKPSKPKEQKTIASFFSKKS
eukprot:jgi/Picsp_1/6810/NSC_04149-R1_zgc:136471 protein